jgi:hemerythrin
MFEAIDELARCLKAGGSGAIEALAELRARAALHYAAEELYMASWSYPGIEAHAEAHAALLGEIEANDADELILFLKDCLLRHTLLVDRLYMPFITRGDKPLA